MGIVGGDDSEMGFQNGDESSMNCCSSSSGMNMNMNKMVGEKVPFFNSGWDPILSLNQQHESFGGGGGGSSMVVSEIFSNPNGFHHHQYSSPVSSYADMVVVPKLSGGSGYESGNFSDIVGSFCLSSDQCNTTQIPNYGFSSKLDPIKESSNDPDCIVSGGTGSPDGKPRKRAPDSSSIMIQNMNSEDGPSSENSDVLKQHNEKKPKLEDNNNLRGKQPAKQSKDNSNSGEDPKESYIHVRARRGQATNSHSLAERVRREKISERMRLLQELVPGCNKITGKAVMLDEIINYVQSLQQQVEFLSMKLATVNPELNVDIERILSKDVLHSRGGNNPAFIGLNPRMNSSSNPYNSHGLFQGIVPNIHHTNPHFPPLPHTVLENELQSLFQMGFDSSSSIDGRLKPDM